MDQTEIRAFVSALFLTIAIFIALVSAKTDTPRSFGRYYSSAIAILATVVSVLLAASVTGWIDL